MHVFRYLVVGLSSDRPFPYPGIKPVFSLPFKWTYFAAARKAYIRARITVLRVTVKLFAAYREKAGASELILDLPSGAHLESLVQEVLYMYPTIASNASTVVAAINQEYADHTQELRDGDEVALIPPVSGG